MSTNEKSANGHIIFSHGLESGPNATKISRLAQLAEVLGWRCERPDYSDLREARERVERLLDLATRHAGKRLLLVGSSMGAYISARVSLQLEVQGLFLLAPPVVMPGAPPLDLRAPVVQLVHGWRDELIPPEEVLGFASLQSLPTLLVDDDHRLGASLDAISACFRHFLQQLART